MPWGDGTGPLGRGPRTGRGAGYCNGYGVPGYMNPGVGYGFGRGWGRGFGRGFGGGYGRGFGFGRFMWYRNPEVDNFYPGAPTTETPPNFDEERALKLRISSLKKEISELEKRLSVISKKEE